MVENGEKKEEKEKEREGGKGEKKKESREAGGAHLAQPTGNCDAHFRKPSDVVVVFCWKRDYKTRCNRPRMFKRIYDCNWIVESG